jgi:hypothetical protein
VAYVHQANFLELAYKKGYITEDEYTEARSLHDDSVSLHLEGKGGGKGSAPTFDMLNPYGYWRQLTAGAQLDTVRQGELRQ